MYHPRAEFNNNLPIISTQFKVYFFQPDACFYESPFDDRLKELEKQIELVKKDLQDTQSSGLIKALFIAPEYLFKDFSKSGKDRYFSAEQKNKFKESLMQLSKNTDLILVPGTICWQKNSKDNQKTYYRNMIYFVHQGAVMKYRKSNPHQNFDLEFSGGKLGQHVFFKKGHKDSNIITINGLTIGVEICLDNYKNQIMEANDITKIDAHIIVADKLPEVQFLPLSGTLTVKVERTPAYNTLIGINEKKHNEVKLQKVDTITPLTQHLQCYTFLEFKLKSENSQQIFKLL
ncbi:nitrilase-related carbon-nitrogen hydrolase [Legionella maceachernii]|uniref:CN hydrolase domain-containing protein n=1 Tax=Legionella maceachernii TaxID=466 RepID=A0A0W0W5K6_9GAMM|nr:nitrilase-related carbon-nitrogen hydrolase [Legionella maceachernii]KTD27174.1 hypothetical protein Lmac_1422 [Legionella maceachernii]SKA13571.1 hypothetical protein SAMN02745128_02234 [Legionella maceachernii]SUP04791.1 Uncharacterised protein [Legionella maceachernii]